MDCLVSRSSQRGKVVRCGGRGERRDGGDEVVGRLRRAADAHEKKSGIGKVSGVATE
jgi:hypothetical protein